MANVIIKPDPAQLVIDRWNVASAELETQKFKWGELDKMFKLGSLYNLDARQDERGRYTHPSQTISRVSSSIIKDAVETITAALMALFNAADGWFIVIPSPGSVTKAVQARYIEDKLKAQLDERAYGTLFRAVAQIVKFGTAVVKTRWDVEVGKVISDTPYFDSDRTVKMEREVSDGVTYRGNRLDLVPYWQFAPDPKGRTIDECEYVCEELFINVDKLLEIAEQTGVYDADAVKALQTEINRQGGSDPRSTDSEYYGVDIHRRDVRIIDYWEDHKHIAFGMPRWGGLTVSKAAGKVLNKNVENPFYHQQKPYTGFRFSLDEKSFYSQGTIEPLRDLHNVDSTALNQFIDAITMNLRPMRLIDADLDVDIKELMNYVPGKVLPVEDLNNGRLGDRVFEFKPEITGILNSLLPFRQQTKDEANRISGVTGYITGNPGMGANRTASGVAMLTQNAEKRGVTPQLLMNLSAQRMLKQMHENNQQFGDPREPLAGDYSFVCFGDAQGNRIMRAQGLEKMLPLIATLGGDMLATVKRLGQAYEIPGIDELLPRDGTMDENQKKMMMGQITQMMMQGGGKGQAA